MKQPGLDTDFEAFRRERNMRRQQRLPTHRPQGNTEVWAELEASEANDLHNQLINAEVDDFFSDATRMAANIVKKVAANRNEELTERLRREMEEFLTESIRHAHNLMMSLPKDTSNHGQETVDANLRNLDVKEIDEFRAAGTAQLEDKHLGQELFPSGQHEGADAGEGAAATEPAAPRQARAPVSEVRSLELPDLSASEELISDQPLSLSEEALGLDPGGEIAGFQPGGYAEDISASPLMDEADDEVEDVSSAMPPAEIEESVVEETVVEAPAASAAEDELPLAALYEGDGAMHEPEPAAPVAQPAPPSAREPGEDKQAQIRAALLELVKQGVMTKDQARAAYIAQTKAR